MIGTVQAGAGSNKRRPSPEIWKHFMWAETDGRSDSQVFHEDFGVWPLVSASGTTENILGYRVFTSTSTGVITDAAIANVDAIAVVADDDNEGAVFTPQTSQIRITANTGRQVGFECRFKTSTIADTKAGFFMGLFEAIVPTATSHIQASGVMADKNFIGFHRLEGDGDKMDLVWKADGQTQHSDADAVTLVADTFIKVGFYFDGAGTIKFYVNEVALAAATYDAVLADLTAVTFPSDINLTMAFAMINAAGSSPCTTTLDWIRWGRTYVED